MEVRPQGRYEIAHREMVAEGADLRVQVLTLAAGQCVPWHHHSEVTDNFVCLEGETVVEAKAPGKINRLKPGQRCAVGPNVVHTVHGYDDGPCTVMVIQGVGSYDFVPVDA